MTGYCTKPGQVEKIIRAGERLERELLERSRRLSARINPVAAICPHDDHLYSGRIALHVLPAMARAGTVIIFGVMHRRARLESGGTAGTIILDGFRSWESSDGPVPVDNRLREFIAEHLGGSRCVVSDEVHEMEHSIEGMLPFLQYYNPHVKILPVIVAGMDFGEMRAGADELSGVISDYLEKNDLRPGADLSMVISVDATHYGPDFSHSPFGTGKNGHRLGTERDKRIGDTFLAGEVTESKMERLTGKFVDEDMTWCGRYSVPFGLLTAAAATRKFTSELLLGTPLRYSDSYTSGVLPVQIEGLGITAPFSLEHWVGYWAILYGTATKGG